MSDKWLSDDELNNILGGENEETEVETNDENEMNDELLDELLSSNDRKKKEEKQKINKKQEQPVFESEDVEGREKKEVEVSDVELQELTSSSLPVEDGFEFEMLYDVPLTIRVLLGTTKMTIEEILELKEESIVKLDKLAGEPVEVIAGEQVVAKGETVTIDDKFGVLITEIVPPRERVKTLKNHLKRQKQ